MQAEQSQCETLWLWARRVRLEEGVREEIVFPFHSGQPEINVTCVPEVGHRVEGYLGIFQFQAIWIIWKFKGT